MKYHLHAARLLFAIPAVMTGAAAWSDPPTADTSAWKCEMCPFMQGYAAEAEAGVIGASGANATFGRYTGIDHGGAYADLSASGQYRNQDGTFADYDLENLGLDSRDVSATAGREGRYDVRFSYDGQPNRLYDTGATPFQANGSSLALPSGWVPAASTGGMSALNASLAPVEIGSDRQTVSLLARYFATPSWTMFGEFRHQEHAGTSLTGASFLTEATQLSQPFDYVTDSLEAGVAWAGRNASVHVSYLGSWFTDNYVSTTFANPYIPIVPGSTQGQIGTPPSNDLQQLTARGNIQLPLHSTLTFAASLGTLKQNSPFLPDSTLPGSVPSTPGSLDGDVHLSHYALGLGSRPLPKLSLRGNASYDGRDDKTSALTVPYVITDTYPGNPMLTPRYSEDKVHLDGGADYTLVHWMKIGVGGTLDDIHYGPGQVVTWTQDAQSWGVATFTPIEALSFTFKGGNALRKVSAFDAAALPPNENPLIRMYNYAPRDRVFYSLTGAWNVTDKLTWSLEGAVNKDDYRNSPLGLQAVHEERGSTALTWTPSESLSAFIDGGYQHLSNLQSGSTGATTLPPWLAQDNQRNWNLGIGGRWVPQERWTLSADYLLAPSYDNTEVTALAPPQAFPQNWTKLNIARLDAAYRWTSALQVHFQYLYETYNSSDWWLNGVGPQTLPNLLALGIKPQQDHVNLFSLTVRYQFGRDDAAAASKTP
jgi:MtrB/PioB family decaheme-associated outer membrane protein